MATGPLPGTKTLYCLDPAMNTERRLISARTAKAAVLSLAALSACGLLAASTAATAPVVGIDAVLSARALLPVHPERAMLMAVTHAGTRLVAVGEQGGVVLSDDQGRTWRSARSVPVAATLTNVRFADAQTGWAIGHLGVVLKTTDGGETWTRQLDGRAIAQLALAQAGAADDAARTDAQALVDDGPDKPLLDLLVDDAQHLTVVGAFNIALRSSDGGQQWQLISHQFDNPNRLHLYGLTRLGGQPGGRLVSVGEQATVLTQAGEGNDNSNDNGGHLKAVKAPYEGSFFGVLATGPHSLLIYGLRGNAFISTDAGNTWTPTQVQGGGASLNTAVRLKDGRVLMGDQGGNVFLSTDAGAHFQRLAFAWGAPLTGMAEAADGSVVLSSLAGLTTVPATALATSLSTASEPPTKP